MPVAIIRKPPLLDETPWAGVSSFCGYSSDMSIGLGFLFWIIVIVSAVLWGLRDRYAWGYGWALIACVIILGVAEFGGLHIR